MYYDPDGHDDILSNLVTMFSVWLAKKKYGNSNKKVSLDASAYINSNVTTQANDYYNASGEEGRNIYEKLETGVYLYQNAPTIIKNYQEERNKTVYNGKVSAASIKENVTTGTGLFLIESHKALTDVVQNPGNALYNLSSFLQPDWQVKVGYTFGQRFQEYANADFNTRIMLGTQDTEFVASMVAPEIPKGFKALKNISAPGIFTMRSPKIPDAFEGASRANRYSWMPENWLQTFGSDAGVGGSKPILSDVKALRDAGLTKAQRRLVYEKSAGVESIDTIKALDGKNNIALGVFEPSYVKPRGEPYPFRPAGGNIEGRDFFYKETKRLNARLMEDPKYAELENLIPELQNVDGLLFFTKSDLVKNHYLTAKELNYVLTNPDILAKTKFVTHFMP